MLALMISPICYAEQSLYRDSEALFNDINHAQSSVYVSIFTLLPTNPKLHFTHGEYVHQVLYALAKAKQRGVHVHVILNRFGSTSRSVDRLLQSRELHWCQYHHIDCSLSSTRFSYSHQKFIVIDHAIAYILTGNLPWCWYSTNCSINYMIQTGNKNIVRYLLRLWQIDRDNGIHQKKFTPVPIPTELIVSPENTDHQIIRFIDDSKQSLWILQPFLSEQDHLPVVLVQSLRRAIKRHVSIHVVTDMPTSNKHWQIHPALIALAQSSQLFTVIKNPSSHFLHAKVMVRDKESAIIGSLNWSDDAFYNNREVSIITHDRKIVSDLLREFDNYA